MCLALGLALFEMVSFTCHSYPERSLLLILLQANSRPGLESQVCLWLPPFQLLVPPGLSTALRLVAGAVLQSVVGRPLCVL